MKSSYAIEGFKPQIIDKSYLMKLNISNISEVAANKLEQGSRLFADRFKMHQAITFANSVKLIKGDNWEFEVHNYTGRCPTNTFELNPVAGSCPVGCLYCLVNDGLHISTTEIRVDYHKAVQAHLNANKDERAYYYLSPKSEVFHSTVLETGIVHRILREFIRHFKILPHSNVRLFIASKAGISELLYVYDGATIIDLLTELSGKMQFNTSIGMMPEEIFPIVEPFAATIPQRLDAVSLLTDRGVHARSALFQPILLPYVNEERLVHYLSKFSAHGIINIKPEFLTVCPENLAVLAQIVGHYDRNSERELYELYLDPSNEDHKKQRDRTAPLRHRSREVLRQIHSAAQDLGITLSICYWVRKELQIPDDEIPHVNRNGFQCLGYQTRLWE